MHLRVTKRRRSEVSIYDPIGNDREGNEIMLIDVLGSEPNVIPDQVVAREEVELLHKELRILAPKERYWSCGSAFVTHRASSRKCSGSPGATSPGSRSGQ